MKSLFSQFFFPYYRSRSKRGRLRRKRT